MLRDLLDRHAVLRLVVYLAAIVAVLYTGGLLWSAILHFGTIIVLVFLAWVIAFILFPLAIALERRGVPRLVAISLIYFMALVAAAAGIVLSVVMIQGQTQHLAGRLMATFTPGNLNHLETVATDWLERVGLSPTEAHQIVHQATARLPGLASNLSTQAANMATQSLGIIGTLLFDVVLVAIMSFYMMLDGDRLIERWILKLPPSWIPDVRLFQRQVDVIFGGFLRAQLLISAAYALLTALLVAVVGLWQLALLVGVLAGILMLVPLIGPFVSVVPPLLLVLLESPPDAVLRNAIIVFVGLMVGQHLILNLIAPKIMSVHIGLHPLLLFVALLVGAQDGGVWGAIFAGPAAAIIAAMLDVYFVRFQQSSSLYPNMVGSAYAAAGPARLQTADAEEQGKAQVRRAAAVDRRARREAEREVEAELGAEEEAAREADEETREQRTGRPDHAARNGHRK